MTTVLSSTFSKAFAILILLCLLLATTYSVKAEDSTTSAGATTGSTTSTRKDLMQQKVQTQKANAQDKQSLRDESLKQSLRKEKMASREAALKLKLQAFRDQKKATVAGRINDNLNKINQNQTTQMQKYLANMSSILDKLENRVNSGSADIKNVAVARDAIARSRTTIASVSAALTLQSQKDYTITLTSEAKVKQDAQKMREQLHTDLQDLRKTVIDAKQSVANAIRVAKSDKKEGTPSGQ